MLYNFYLVGRVKCENENMYQTRNEKSLVWISNGLWIVSRFIYRDTVRNFKAE